MATCSRLCVKNLPKHATEKRLRDHFSVKGEVTDVKIIKTRDGTSRQMAFVGFKSEEHAQAALHYFNNSFIDTMRISVEYARKFGDQEISRPWSRHSAGSSANQRLSAATAPTVPIGPTLVDGAAAEKQARKGKTKFGKPELDDPRLAEFLSLMAPRSKAKIWTDDFSMPTEGPEPGPEQEQALPGSAGSGSDDEEYQDLELGAAGGGAGRRASALAAAAAGRYDDDGSGDEDAAEASGGEEEEEDGGAGVGAAGGTGAGVEVTGGLSDMEYMRSRMKKWEDSDDEADVDAAGGTGDVQGLGEEEEEGEGEEEEEAEEAEGEEGAQEVVFQEDGTSAGLDGEEGEEQPEAMDEEAGAHGDEEHVDPQPQVVHETEAAEEANIADTGRLFVRNLAYTTTESDLSELFGKYGNLTEVHLVLDRESKRSKGIAYVLFQVPEDAVRAHDELDMTSFQGRLLHILAAKKPPSRASVQTSAEAAEDGFKAERNAQRKADAGNRSAWNTLFMRPDTVAEAVAAHYGISKSELLDRSASDLPVRMALGEAHVVAQTKQALADAGVDITTLEAAAAVSGKASATASVARSPTTLLVKNLPYTATEQDIEEMFGKCGQVCRVVLPPTKTLALVEFSEPQDARSAFKALAYKKYQHVPLYLEWAPRDVFSTPAAPRAPKAQPKAQPSASTPKQQQQRPGAAGEDDDDTGDAGAAAVAAIFVKGLAFASTDASLKKHFDRAVSAAGGSMRSAKIARKKGPEGQDLSMGFGFVEVDSEQVAKTVIKQLQGSMLDGHQLSLQLSRAKAGEADKAKGKKKRGAQADDESTKLVVRNVAFEATRKDIAALFSPFGHLKSCRLPKKFDNTHRGFAFIEFVTKQEARNAMEGVGGAHLYGRRLVVEYAAEEGGLDELRAKTASKYRGAEEDAELLGAAPGAKRIKRNL